MTINAYRRRSPRVCLARRLSRESGCIDFEAQMELEDAKCRAVRAEHAMERLLSPGQHFQRRLGHESLDDSMGFVVVVVR